MTDDLLARARQALERITPAPWTQVGFGNIHAEPVGDHPPVAKTWNRANGDFIAAAPELVRELIDALTAARAEVDRLHTWAGLMSLLDTYYPEDIFPTQPDGSPDRDPGPRIVSLIRYLENARAENERLRAQLDAVPSAIRAYAGGELDGYSYHGDGSAIEALRRLSEHAENIRDYAATRQETTDEQ